MKTVLFPLPDHDFDTTEAAVTWRRLVDAGHTVRFATQSGRPAQTDPKLLTGVLFGQLGAKPVALECFRAMQADSAFQSPQRWQDVAPDSFEALHLTGGHAKGMRPYLESPEVQALALRCFEEGRQVAAVCHGPIVLARTRVPATGLSVLHGRRCTGLTKLLEGSAWAATAWKLGDYYRTYPEWVQDELTRAVGPTGRIETGPTFAPFVVEDGNLLTARWPGDVEAYAAALVRRLA